MPRKRPQLCRLTKEEIADERRRRDAAKRFVEKNPDLFTMRRPDAPFDPYATFEFEHLEQASDAPSRRHRTPSAST